MADESELASIRTVPNLRKRLPDRLDCVGDHVGRLFSQILLVSWVDYDVAALNDVFYPHLVRSGHHRTPAVQECDDRSAAAQRFWFEYPILFGAGTEGG